MQSRPLTATDNRARQPSSENESSLADKAFQILEEMIITLRLAPGSRWSEAAICDTVGIGRTPVREALQRLAMVQLIQIVPRYGIIITDILATEQMLVVELRRALEPLLASRAARRSTLEEKVEIAECRRRLLDLLEQRDPVEYLRLHMGFRQLLYRCARNKYLAASMPPVDALSRRFFYLHRSKPDELLKAGTLHAAMLLAISTADEAAAIEAANRLVDHTDEFTRAAFHDHY